MRLFKRIAVVLFAVYLVPGLAAAGLWAVRTHPQSYHQADWSSAGILPDPYDDPEARVVIFAANTGGFKGAFAVHSWIVVKHKDAEDYDRYDVVGWGRPIRKNKYDADGRWYSNMPQIVWQAKGKEAEALIPKVEAAIDNYPYHYKGDYRLWPGPNSNTFVASVMRAVPEIDAVLPSNAVGRDYLTDDSFYAIDPAGDAHVTLYGLIGFSAGIKSGFEFHLLGAVAGIDFRHPGLKIPAIGRVGM